MVMLQKRSRKFHKRYILCTILFRRRKKRQVYYLEEIEYHWLYNNYKNLNSKNNNLPKKIPNIIGITIETRPDFITRNELHILRSYGCKIQMGIQHTDDYILKLNKRDCTNKANKRGILLALNNGFKVDIHLMLDLPGSSPEKDLKSIKDAIYDSDLRVDQWKLYPTAVLNDTLIKKWYENGSYKPYGDIDNSRLIREVLIQVMKLIPPYVRVNRIIREFPTPSIIGGCKRNNMRQDIESLMIKENIFCNEIRHSEIKDNNLDLSKAKLNIYKYKSSKGINYFISYNIFVEKDNKNYIIGFSLRINNNNKYVCLTFLKIPH